MPGGVTVLFPFSAIVGQEPMRLALLLNAVDPRLGGVLIRGERGTAKSTMARALAELLPDVRVVAGCRFGCDPDIAAGRCEEHADLAEPAVETRPMRVVELPANATEDRLAGAIDVEGVLKRGEVRFEPGLLAAANRGILYVDEVNLLPDHLVDMLLDAAAMGRNVVEREGFSVAHPARFVLIGTMNPEEGELRPQLLDRFGLCVDVQGIMDVDQRVEVMRRRAAFETDAAAFAAAWQQEQTEQRARLAAARALLPAVRVPDALLRLIAGLAVELGVDGHRADIVMHRAAAALAALEGRDEVTAEDVQRVAALALRHRTRRTPFEQERFSDEQLNETIEQLQDQPVPPTPQSPSEQPPEDGDEQGAPPDGTPSNAPQPPAAQPAPESRAEPGQPLALPRLDLGRSRGARTGAGRRQPARARDQRGRFVRAMMPHGPAADLALAATVRAAASRRSAATPDLPPAIGAGDLRVKVRERKVGASIILIVDASGSMGARKRMEAAKGAAVTLLTDAYQRRDRVALIAFRGSTAQTLLPLTGSVALAHRRLTELPTGGRTPLPAGLLRGLELIKQVQAKDPRAVCVPVLITDGKANVGTVRGSPLEESLRLASALRQPGIHPLVLDSDDDYLNLGLASRLAEHAGAQYVRLASLSAQAIAGSVERLAKLAVKQ